MTNVLPEIVLPDMTGFIEVFHHPVEGPIADVFAEQGRYIHPVDPVLGKMKTWTICHTFARSFPAEVSNA